MKDESENVTAPVLRDQWNVIQGRLDDVVVCLERESGFAAGRLKPRLSRVADFLKQKPSCDDVLGNRDALAFLLPLLKSTLDKTNAGSQADENVEVAVRSGVQRIARTAVYRRNWLQLFWYPALVMAVAFFVSVLLSFAVAPQFETALKDMHDFGFELEVPWLPHLAFSIARFLRWSWVPIVIGICFVIFATVWINRWQRQHSPLGLGWWDDHNISVRGALAIWSNHLANLLSVGVSQTEAFVIASRESPKETLRKLSSALGERDKAMPKDAMKPYFPLGKYAMLDHALKQNSLSAKTTALEEVAFYYRNRDQFVSTWWMSWVSTALLWLTGFCVLALFLVMFLPLYGTIRGVSGLVTGLGN